MVPAVSAGGIVYRRRGSEIDVVLVGRFARQLWGLPKGTLHRGEDVLHAALREVREETGLDVRALEPLGAIEYWFVSRGTHFHKTVHYYLMESTGGDLSRHDAEYDVARWFTLLEAYDAMSYRNEVESVRLAERAIRRRESLSKAAGDLPSGLPEPKAH